MKKLMLSLSLLFISVSQGICHGAPLQLRPGDRYTIDYRTVDQYGGRIEVSCGRRDDNPPPPWGGGRRETISLGNNSCGNGAGACACVVSGREYVPNRQNAEIICRNYGYSRLIDFKTRDGARGELHCDPATGNCFQNKSSGNLVCSEVTCER